MQRETPTCVHAEVRISGVQVPLVIGLCEVQTAAHGAVPQETISGVEQGKRGWSLVVVVKAIYQVRIRPTQAQTQKAQTKTQNPRLKIQDSNRDSENLEPSN